MGGEKSVRERQHSAPSCEAVPICPRELGRLQVNRPIVQGGEYPVRRSSFVVGEPCVHFSNRYVVGDQCFTATDEIGDTVNDS